LIVIHFKISKLAAAITYHKKKRLQHDLKFSFSYLCFDINFFCTRKYLHKFILYAQIFFLFGSFYFVSWIDCFLLNWVCFEFKLHINGKSILKRIEHQFNGNVSAKEEDALPSSKKYLMGSLSQARTPLVGFFKP
jgi:hypothetical protein